MKCGVTGFPLRSVNSNSSVVLLLVVLPSGLLVSLVLSVVELSSSVSTVVVGLAVVLRIVGLRVVVVVVELVVVVVVLAAALNLSCLRRFHSSWLTGCCTVFGGTTPGR